MRGVVYYFLLCCISPPLRAKKAVLTQDLLINFVRDNLQDVNREMNRTDPIRQNCRQSAGYEIGFVLRSMEECYRRMVDIYNSSLTTDLYTEGHTTDHIMFLKHVEMLHWVLEHLANMLHEIEKKYKIKTAGMFEKHEIWTTTDRTTLKRRKEHALSMATTKRPTKRWWPLDYGWDVPVER